MLRAAARSGLGIVRGVRGLGTGPGKGQGANPQPRIDPELLAYLVCPLSRKRLRSVGSRGSVSKVVPCRARCMGSRVKV
ncbi:protein preY, mitochondrial isoform X2 [Mobula birostris]|uniref:protein preY, mitochondrial isoform X2 n=1 Tax=Mobula birostris TaxID=1983395 RepID=UPI003B28AFB6